MNLSFFGSRKVGIALCALVMSFVLAMFGHVSGTEWVTVVGLIVGLFGAANVGSKIAGRPSDKEAQ